MARKTVRDPKIQKSQKKKRTVEGKFDRPPKKWQRSKQSLEGMVRKKKRLAPAQWGERAKMVSINKHTTRSGREP